MCNYEQLDNDRDELACKQYDAGLLERAMKRTKLHAGQAATFSLRALSVK